jgi:hypothetical protein
MGGQHTPRDTGIVVGEGTGTSGRGSVRPSPEQVSTPVVEDQRSQKDKLDEIRTIYTAIKSAGGGQEDGKNIQHFGYVELGVGWSVDPAHLVGKRVLVHCALAGEWHECAVLNYDEETAEHEIRVEIPDVTLKLPLTGVKVRIRMFLGEPMPPKPNLIRMCEVRDKVRAGVERGTYCDGFTPGIERGIQKLTEAIWQQCYFAQNNSVASGSSGDPDGKEYAHRLLTEDSEAVEYVTKVLMSSSVSHLKLQTMPRWLESEQFPPGDIVWVKFSKQHWPCLVVSADHFMDLDGERDAGFCISPQIESSGKPKEMVAVYYFYTNERELVSRARVVDFTTGLEKGYAKTTKPDKFSMSIQHVLAFVKTGNLSSELRSVLQAACASGDERQLRWPPHLVNASYIVPRGRSEDASDMDLSEDFTKENLVDNEMVAAAFCKDWQPTANFLKGISGGDLELLSLGRVETNNPYYHTKTHVWPVGYKIRRKLRSKFTVEGKKEPHIIEIMPPLEKPGACQPRIRVSMERKERGKPRMEVVCLNEGPTAALADFVKSTGTVKNVEAEGVLGPAVATLLGLNRRAIRLTTFMLPGVEKCEKIDRIRVDSERAKFIEVQDKSLLDEMKACQLPEGIQPVPLQRGRAFECQVCGDIEDEDDDQILQCDGCRNCVHMSCYSVSEAPHGRLWLCDVCRAGPTKEQRPACVICPVEGGVMKRTTEGKWCHPACAIWTPETHILPGETHFYLTGLIGGVKNICRSRMESRCTFCKQTYGAVIQCCAEGDDCDCYKAFHYMCAKNKGCELRIETHNPEQWAGPASPEPRTPLAAPDINTEVSAKSVDVDWEEMERVRKDPQFPSLTKSEVSANIGVSIVECEHCRTTSTRKWRLYGDETPVVMCDDCFVWVKVNLDMRPSEFWRDCGNKRLKGPSKRKKKKTDSKGLIIGDTRLLSFCDKHSSVCAHQVRPPDQAAADTSEPISFLGKDVFVSKSFPGLDCIAWKRNNGHIFNKSSYVQATSLCPRGPIPEPSEAGGSMLKSVGVVTELGDGMSMRKHLDDASHMGVPLCVGWLNQAPVAKRGIMSQADAYKQLVENWRLDIHPGKSAIHGWGAFAPDRSFKEGEMIIEYVGELVRPTFAEIREAKVYDDLVGAGTYVFRINPEYCVDATRTGNLAHLLNHSCDANCASRTITVKGRDGQPVDHVVIFADRDIQAGEELTYDYRFSGEEVLQCCCGSLKCRGKVNQSLPISFEGGWADARRLKSSLKRKQCS